MLPRELKKSIVKESIRKQQSIIRDFLDRLSELKESERTSNDEELDAGNLAQKVQMDTEVLTLNNQLEFANQEMKLLQKLAAEERPPHSATLGAVVVTDKDAFYISASTERFTANGKPYIGISSHSPLFESMRGKKEGDCFSFNTTTYCIQEIF